MDPSSSGSSARPQAPPPARAEPSRPGPRIAVTGGIGSGKSTVCALLGALGAFVLDCDAIARELSGAGGAAIPALRARFGAGAIATDGSLDRAAMRRLAFSDPQARRDLEAILHPLVRDTCAGRARPVQEAGRAVVIDIPLLAEIDPVLAPGPFSRVVVVDCPVSLQRERALARGGIRPEELEGALAAQAGREQRLALASDVLFNGGDIAGLGERVSRLFASACAQSV